jgi:hypothetical protein
VNFVNPTRCARLWFSIAFVALALSVFSWGIGYKLSLYDPPQSNSHLTPKAKLLSKNERIVREISPLIDGSMQLSPVTQGVLFWWIMLPVAVLLLKTPAFSVWELEATKSWQLRRRLSCLNIFFFRPPPILG